MKKYTWLLVVGAACIVIGLGILILSPKQPAPSLDSISTSDAPWPAELTHLRERLAAISLPALSAEGTVLHIHQHLDIFIHGKSVEVPAGIGIHEDAPAFISPIHVHDTTGIIHVESPTVQKYYLGQFFDIWGVRLTATCLGSYCTEQTNKLTFYVNGTPYQGDPRQIELTSHEEIVITYGTDAELPKPLPVSYAFPQGY